MVVVPFFRPLRIFIFGSRAWVGFRRLVNVDFLLVYGIGLVIIAATLKILAINRALFLGASHKFELLK